MALKKRNKKIRQAMIAVFLAAFITLAACGGGGKEKTARPDPDCPTATDGQKTVKGACPAPDVPIAWDK